MKRIKTNEQFQQLQDGQKILFVHWHFLGKNFKVPILVIGRVYSEIYQITEIDEQGMKDYLEDGFIIKDDKICYNTIGWKTMQKGDGLLLTYAKPSKENLWEATHLVWKLK